MQLIKKYSNRRLYDTVTSRYISLDELAEIVRSGKDVRVVDARTGNDLTQLTLAQVIFESKNAARLLPAQLLTQLIRLSDDALAEFLGQYVSAALDIYLQAKQGVQAMAPYVPFAPLAFGGTNALARLLTTALQGVQAYAQVPSPPQQPPMSPAVTATPAGGPPSDDVAALRRELEELKASLRKRQK